MRRSKLDRRRLRRVARRHARAHPAQLNRPRPSPHVMKETSAPTPHTVFYPQPDRAVRRASRRSGASAPPLVDRADPGAARVDGLRVRDVVIADRMSRAAGLCAGTCSWSCPLPWTLDSDLWLGLHPQSMSLRTELRLDRRPWRSSHGSPVRSGLKSVLRLSLCGAETTREATQEPLVMVASTSARGR